MKLCGSCGKKPATKRFGEIPLCDECMNDFKVHAVETMKKQYGKDVKVSFDAVVKDLEREDT